MIQIIDILSWLAMVLGVLGNIPQVIRIFKTRSVRDLSMTTNLTWLFVITIMFLRAFFIVKDNVFILSNGLQLVVLVALVFGLLKYRGHT